MCIDPHMNSHFLKHHGYKSISDLTGEMDMISDCSDKMLRVGGVLQAPLLRLEHANLSEQSAKKNTSLC